MRKESTGLVEDRKDGDEAEPQAKSGKMGSPKILLVKGTIVWCSISQLTGSARHVCYICFSHWRNELREKDSDEHRVCQASVAGMLTFR